MGKRAVSNADVEALFGSDEDAEMSAENDSEEEEGVEDDSAEESTEDDEEAQDEQEESEEESDEDSEDQETEENSEIDWSKVDPKIKAAYDKAAEASAKWERNHAKLQGKFTKTTQAQREQETALASLKQKATILDRLESIVQSDPRLEQYLASALNKQNNPLAAAQAPVWADKDPMYQYIQENVAPIIGQLQNQIKELSEKASGNDPESRQAKAQKNLDTVLDSISSTIKDKLGRDASEEDLEDALEYLVDNQLLVNFDPKRSGALAKAVFYEKFGDQLEVASRKKYEMSLREKSKKLGARTKTVNSRVQSKQKGTQAESVEEAIAMAIAEQDID